MRNLHWLLTIALFALACGGSEKKAETVADESYEEEPEEEEDDVLIPEEKFEEIKRTFERKATTVARCFPEAVEAGELDINERVKLTVGLIIQPDGSSSELKVLGTTKRSKTLEACVVKSVGRWEFTTLPKPLRYSYGFVLQRF